MSKKYHINNLGEIGICTAKTQPCRFSTIKHTEDLREAQVIADLINDPEKTNLRKFLESEDIELSSNFMKNELQKEGFYQKSKIHGSCYRGESDKGETGLALYGAGIYSTTNKKIAKEYGKVRLVDYDELPSNPLCLKDKNSFNKLEQDICEKYGISKRDLYIVLNPEHLIKRLGYDGITLGNKEEMIIVYFPNRRNGVYLN